MGYKIIVSDRVTQHRRERNKIQVRRRRETKKEYRKIISIKKQKNSINIR